MFQSAELLVSVKQGKQMGLASYQAGPLFNLTALFML